VSELAAVARAAQVPLRSEILEIRPVSGGDLNDGYDAHLADGRRVFIKSSRRARSGAFINESAGLRWIRRAHGAPRVPEMVAVIDPVGADDGGPRMLILEWIDTGPLSAAGEEQLGRGLAALHRAGAPNHGAPPPTDGSDGRDDALIIGPIALPSTRTREISWPEVYADLRLRPTARTAAERGRLDRAALRAVEHVCDHLPELAGPPEPPARLHGDLWGGNVLADTTGAPVLIDPAAYGGHREVDLAMLRLFGGPGERCFAAYNEAYPLSEGHEDRVALWQLFPILVHAALFGGGYGAQASAICRHYVA
jgi:fructosamine-3-kinase